MAFFQAGGAVLVSSNKRRAMRVVERQRLLLGTRARCEELESVDEVRGRLRPEQYSQLEHYASRVVPLGTAHSRKDRDPFASAIARMFEAGEIDLIVRCKTTEEYFQLNRYAVDQIDWSFCVRECIREGRLITKPELMTSYEARLDGATLCIRTRQLAKYFKVPSAPDKDQRTAIEQYYEEDRQPTNAKLLTYVKAALPLHKVSRSRVLELAIPYKNKTNIASKPGPRPRSTTATRGD